MKKRGTKPRAHIGPWLTKYAILERMGVKQPVIIDGGAGTGQTTEFYLRMWPDAQVYLFEPNTSIRTPLRVEYKDNPRIRIYGEALGSQKASGRPFYVGGRNGEMSSMYLRAPNTRQYYYANLPEGPKVNVVALDGFAEAEGITHIDILKMDLQGGEYNALRGARNLLKEQRVTLVYTEVLFIPVYKAPTYLKVFNYLGRLGYTLFDLFDVRRAPVSRQIKVADALFISKEARTVAIDTLPTEAKRESRRHALGAPTPGF